MDGAGGIHLNVLADLIARATQVREIVDGIRRYDDVTDLHDEGVETSTGSGLKATGAEVDPTPRRGRARHKSIPGRIYVDGVAIIVALGADIRGVDQTGRAIFVGIDLGYKRVRGGSRGLRRTICLTRFVETGLLCVLKRKFGLVGRSLYTQHGGGAGDVHAWGVSARIHRNAAADSNGRGRIAAPEVSGVEHARRTAAQSIDLAGEELEISGIVRYCLVAVRAGGERVDLGSGIAGSGDAGDIRVLILVDGKSGNRVGRIARSIGAREICGIGECISVVDQGYCSEESVRSGYRRGLRERVAGRKVDGSGGTGKIDVSVLIDCNSCQAVD